MVYSMPSAHTTPVDHTKEYKPIDADSDNCQKKYIYFY